MQSSDFQTLLADVENGSEDAAWALVEQLTPHIQRVVSRRMGLAIQRRIGASDIVQAAWASFLLRTKDLAQFTTEDAARRYLVGIAINKLRMARRANAAQGRDLRRESREGVNEASESPRYHLTPSQIVSVRETWTNTMASWPSHHRRIVELKIQGCTNSEIANQLDINERTVRRVLDGLVSALSGG